MTLTYPRDCSLRAPHHCPPRELTREREVLPCNCVVERGSRVGEGAYSYECRTLCEEHAM